MISWAVDVLVVMMSPHQSHLNPAHTNKKKKTPTIIGWQLLWGQPYLWQQFELKPYWRLRIIGNIMVDHYVLLYMGCILSIVHMTIFFFAGCFRMELSGWETRCQTEASKKKKKKEVSSFFKEKKSVKKNKNTIKNNSEVMCQFFPHYFVDILCCVYLLLYPIENILFFRCKLLVKIW